MQRFSVSTIFALVLVCGSLASRPALAQEKAEKAVQAKIGPHVEGESPRDMCNTAKSDFWNSKINAARFETENGLKRYPKDAPLMTLRGDIELYDCHYAKAVQTYNQALVLSPTFADAFGGRGEALMRQGKFAEARKDIEKARSIKPDHFGFVLDQIGNLDYEAHHRESDPAKKWALATTASLFNANGTGCESLAGGVPNEELANNCQKLLGEWWGVHSRNDLLDILARLGGPTGMHNQRWQAMRQAHGVYDKLKNFRSAWDKTEDFDRALEVLQDHGDEFGDRGLLAWDYARYMNLCREGYRAKYFSEAETWELMAPMAAKIQSLFSSWKQFEDGYLVGREFWCASIYNKDKWRYLRNVYRLYNDPNSPFQTVPWNTKLSAKKDNAAIEAVVNKVRGAQRLD
ncbi:MAG: DUF1266 domain-containing protein [Cyanobacteria bacterium REEB67]|nr:DUF1266 domain-containing protein [Cyanobacteria bacterium REEB67]